MNSHISIYHSPNLFTHASVFPSWLVERRFRSLTHISRSSHVRINDVFVVRNMLSIRNLLIEKLLSAFFSEAVHVIVHPLVNTVFDHVMNPIPQCQRHPPHVGIIHILFLGLHCLGCLLFWSWSPCRLDRRRRSFVINTLCIFWKF